MPDRRILFNPGPTNCSPRVWDALGTGNVCHREPRAARLVRSLRCGILDVVYGQNTHRTVLFGSSGTGANEAALGASSGPILFVRNGKYSERLEAIAKRLGRETHHVSLEDYPSVTAALEAGYAAYPEVRDVGFVHHETTTGQIVPIKDVCSFSERVGVGVVVDAISSFGIEHIDLRSMKIDFLTLTPNKGLQGLPGLSAVVVRKTREIEMGPSYYFSLVDELRSQEEKGQFRFTPPVQIIAAAECAVAELLEEGVNSRRERCRGLKSKLEEGLARLGIDIRPCASSFLVAAVLDPGDYEPLRQHLDRAGITIYSDARTVASGVCRFATLGHMDERDVDILLKELRAWFRGRGHMPA